LPLMPRSTSAPSKDAVMTSQAATAEIGLSL
jgi:hypothetical protein